MPETTDCRNPQWLRLTRPVKEARAEVKRLRSELGEEAEANAEAARPTMRGFKIAHAGLREQLHPAETKVEHLLARRNSSPRHPSTPPSGCSGPGTCHVMQGLCQEV